MLFLNQENKMKHLVESINEYKYIDESLSDITKNISIFIKKNDVFKKISVLAKKLGKEAIRKVLTLYYIMIDPNTEIKDRLSILGTITYLISPIDAVPDTLPGGYTDDIILVTTLLSLLKKLNTNTIKQEVEETIAKWFEEE